MDIFNITFLLYIINVNASTLIQSTTSIKLYQPRPPSWKSKPRRLWERGCLYILGASSRRAAIKNRVTCSLSSSRHKMKPRLSILKYNLPEHSRRLLEDARRFGQSWFEDCRRCRLDYQPLFLKMIPRFPPDRRVSQLLQNTFLINCFTSSRISRNLQM